MEIKIGNIVFGGDSPYKIAPGIQGLGTADIRNGDGLYAGVDGGYMSNQLYGHRTIVFIGFFIANGCGVGYDELRSKLLAELRIRYLYPIFIKSFGNRYYFTEGYVADIKTDIENPNVCEFQISMLCPDPIIYDGGDGKSPDSAWTEMTFYKQGAGGFDMEYVTPVQWTSGERITSIENKGTFNTYPIITLKGTFHNPSINNLTTGGVITLARDIVPGQTVVIDMKNRTITLTDSGGNVVSIASDRTISSSWWSLAPGVNKVVLITTNSSDTEFGTIKFKTGYGGM